MVVLADAQPRCESANIEISIAPAAKALRLLGRHDEALRRQESALALARRIEYGIGAVRALVGLAATRLELGDLDGSRAAAEEAGAAATAAGYRVFAGRALTVPARVHANAGRLADARTAAVEALTLHRATGYRHGVVETTHLLASL